MDSRQASRMAVVVIAAVTIAFPSAAAGNRRPHAPAVTELATFAPGCTGTCGSGSTIGPDGALYVTDGQAGKVKRVDTRSGAVTTFAAGFPLLNTPPGIGGAIDVAFVGHTAYVLVANVGSFFGDPNEVAGIYRVRRNGSAVLVADIGAWAEDNPPPPEIDFVLPGGVQYAMEPFLGGFAVTDGHHNRVIYVRGDGRVRELLQVDNVVPTGLAARGVTLFMGQAGAVPHPPEEGKVVAITPSSAHPGGDRVRSAARRRRGIRPRSPPVRARTGQVGPGALAGQCRRTGDGEHGDSDPGRPRPAQAGRRAARPSDLGRVLAHQRVRGHAHRQGHRGSTASSTGAGEVARAGGSGSAACGVQNGLRSGGPLSSRRDESNDASRCCFAWTR